MDSIESVFEDRYLLLNRILIYVICGTRGATSFQRGYHRKQRTRSAGWREATDKCLFMPPSLVFDTRKNTRWDTLGSWRQPARSPTQMSSEDITDQTIAIGVMSANSPHEVGPVGRVGETPLQQILPEPNVRTCDSNHFLGTVREDSPSNSSEGPSSTVRSNLNITKLLLKEPLKVFFPRATAGSDLRIIVREFAHLVPASRAVFDAIEDTVERTAYDISAQDTFLVDWRKTRQVCLSIFQTLHLAHPFS